MGKVHLGPIPYVGNSMNTRTLPTPVTCREAGSAFRAAAASAVFEHEEQRLSGAADLLEAMGEMPFPAHVLEEYPGVFSQRSV